MNAAAQQQRLPRVLIVDDSPMDRLLAANILEKEDCVSIPSHDGQEALAILARDAPDLLLTDLQMPEMDGLTLVREVKQRYPAVPVILMTGRGSEEIAAEALRVGAASYVPKRNLKRDLPAALASVLAAIETQRERDRVFEFLQHSEYTYVLGYERSGPKALVNHLQECLDQMKICGAIDRLRVGTALAEALVNAIDHGNLELDSRLREEGNAYRELGQLRAQQLPYRDRRVHVTARFTPREATFVIGDEGPGFDPQSLPDPTDPEYLTRPSGRGVMLMRTFMDDVYFNERGNQITLVKRRPA